MIWSVRGKGRKNEGNEQLMRRFKKSIQKFGLVKYIRAIKVHTKKKTKRRLRAEAIKRTEYRAKKQERILWS